MIENNKSNMQYIFSEQNILELKICKNACSKNKIILRAGTLLLNIIYIPINNLIQNLCEIFKQFNHLNIQFELEHI
jgi:hypothetical protein